MNDVNDVILVFSSHKASELEHLKFSAEFIKTAVLWSFYHTFLFTVTFIVWKRAAWTFWLISPFVLSMDVRHLEPVFLLSFIYYYSFY